MQTSFLLLSNLIPKGSGTSFFSFQYFVFFFSFLTLTIYNSLLKLNPSSLQIGPKTTPQASTSAEHQSYVSKCLADITMSMLPTPNSPCPKLPSPSPPASLPPNNVPLPSCPTSFKKPAPSDASLNYPKPKLQSFYSGHSFTPQPLSTFPLVPGSFSLHNLPWETTMGSQGVSPFHCIPPTCVRLI